MNTKTLKEVTDKLYNVLEDFHNDKINNEAFVSTLKSICKGKGNKSFWWRFFPNDTCANDWQSISASLRSPKNTEYLKECILIAISEREMIVYYS